MSTVKCIGILTSGGDAPGMNAAIRAVTRSAIYNGIKVKGIYRGYKGLLLDEIEEFKTQNVSNIIQRGGTILKTARCSEFRTPEGRKQCYDKLMEHGIDVRLYNFPLCKVDRSYWGLCARSITDYKISYLNDCKSCSVRDVCGGVFRSTLNLTGMKLVPIKGERDA